MGAKPGPSKWWQTRQNHEKRVQWERSEGQEGRKEQSNVGHDGKDFELSFVREHNTMKTNTKTKLQPPLMRGLYLYLTLNLTYWDLSYFCLSSEKQLHQSNEPLEKLGFYGLISLIIGHQTPSPATQGSANNKSMAECLFQSLKYLLPGPLRKFAGAASLFFFY